MSDPTRFQLIKQRMDQVGGTAWFEGLLIRGKPEGGIAGMHVEIGWHAPDAFGQLTGKVEGPFTVSSSSSDPEFLEIIGTLNTELAAEVDSLRQQLFEREQAVAQLQEQIDTLTQQLAEQS